MEKKIKIKLMSVFICLVLISILILSIIHINRDDAKNVTYNIDAKVDGAYLSGALELFYVNNNGYDVEELYFCLYPNAFKDESNVNNTTLTDRFNDAYPKGFNEGYIQINSVSVDGENAEYFFEENVQILKVQTGKIKNKGNKSIKIEFEEKMPNSLSRFGYGSTTYNFGNWYPVLCPFENGTATKSIYTVNGDPFFSECADYNVKITLSPEFRIASSGEILSKKIIDPLNTEWNINGRNIRDFAFIISADYKLKSATVNDTVVYSYYLENDKAGEKALDYAVSSLKCFNELFGEYPYSTLSVAEANFYIGGMEYPNLVYISDELYNDAALDALEEVIVHEVAHQWWYGLVGNNEIKEAWLDEGLTQYSVALYYENVYGKERYSSFMNESESYCKVIFEILKRTAEIDNKKIDRSSFEFEHWLLYDALTYDASALMLDELRNVIGDELFFAGLKNYLSENIFKNSSKEIFIDSFNNTTKKNIKGIIEPWLEGRIYWG